MMADDLTGAHDEAAVADELRRTHERAKMRAWLRGQAADRNGNRAWYIVEHRGRDGESLVEEMAEAGVEAWCPMKKIVKRRPRGQACKTVEAPLFEGYIFVRLLADWDAAFLGVMTFDQVRSILGHGEAPTALPERFVKSIKDFEASPPAVQAMLFRSGDAVQVTAGPFASFAAQVTADYHGKGWVDVEVNIFGRLTPCRLGVDSLRLLD